MRINEVTQPSNTRIDELRLLSPTTVDSMSRLLLGKKHNKKIIAAIEEYFDLLNSKGRSDPTLGEKPLNISVADRHDIDRRVFNKYLEYYLEHGKI